MARPGGVISAFCDPETTASSPQESVSSGTAPRLETASTTTSAPASFAAAARPWTSATTPVEVSECVRNTTFAPPVSARRAERSSADGDSPHSYSIVSTSQPKFPAIAAQRSPKWPADTTTTRSPGRVRFEIADSIPPVPDDV